MRYLIISDLHSNLESLRAALEYRDYDAALVLGDIVGYGANPNEVAEIVRHLGPALIVRGNHDRVAAGLDQGELFSQAAYLAAMWTRRVLTLENRCWLEQLPRGPADLDGLLTIAHGSPLDEDEYLFDPTEAKPQFGAFSTPICFVGHTHIPAIFALGRDGELVFEQPRASESFDLDLGRYRFLINPGSVGQPRDGDPRGSFAVYDTAKSRIEFHRYPYDIEAAQRKIMDAGLPPFLARRLAAGR